MPQEQRSGSAIAAWYALDTVSARLQESAEQPGVTGPRFANRARIEENGRMQGTTRPGPELLDAAALCSHLLGER